MMFDLAVPCPQGALRLFAVLFSIPVLFMLLVDTGNCASAKAPLKIGGTPPAFVLTDLKGVPVRTPMDTRGKVVIIHFWTGGCSSCLEEMPAMEKLFTGFGKKGLVILAINVGQKKSVVSSLARELRISYPVLLDTDGKIARLYDVVGLPRTFVIDRNGIIRFKIVGSVAPETLKKQALSLL